MFWKSDLYQLCSDYLIILVILFWLFVPYSTYHYWKLLRYHAKKFKTVNVETSVREENWIRDCIITWTEEDIRNIGAKSLEDFMDDLWVHQKIIIPLCLVYTLLVTLAILIVIFLR